MDYLTHWVKFSIKCLSVMIYEQFIVSFVKLIMFLGNRYYYIPVDCIMQLCRRSRKYWIIVVSVSWLNVELQSTGWPYASVNSKCRHPPQAKRQGIFWGSQKPCPGQNFSAKALPLGQETTNPREFLKDLVSFPCWSASKFWNFAEIKPLKKLEG